MIEKEKSIVSIREVSVATGITIGGIYHYFPIKKNYIMKLLKDII